MSLPVVTGWPPGFAEAMGWVAAGPVLIRLDVAEREGAKLAWSARRRPVPLPPDLASRFSVRGELLPAVLRALGFRILPASSLASGQYGPAQPAMLLPVRRRKPKISADAAEELGRLPRPHAPAGPFAALAALQLRAG